MNQELSKQIEKRRTFAIISHPDAGKTTLTEKLLLYGGAIRMAGSVKARKASRHATSDWMEIEKQRGISVTSSAMQFSYNDYAINILDTPGHQDFSEDTYRTLIAADSAVMLIDGANGVEPQTIKLFEVCRMRDIPIFTFVNKMDRASKDPFDLMDELETVLGIASYPINWPIGIHGDLKGIYHRETKLVELYEDDDGKHGSSILESVLLPIEDPIVRERIGDYLYNQLIDEVDLLEGAGDSLDLEKVRTGKLTPMFFGSAINNFGVESFLNKFLEYTTPPLPRIADIGVIPVNNEQFSAFVFKIQANMNPAHHDRLAFVRICSGKFEAGMDVLHVNTGKNVRLSQPQQFMADERSAVQTAWPGDIIGLFDPGIFSLGDTLITGKKTFQYEGIPMFAPEFFARISPEETLRRKQFVKGIEQLSQEGAMQVFKHLDIGRQELICGVCGVLQFDVLKYRLKGEYGVDIKHEMLPYKAVRWVEDEKVNLKDLTLSSTTIPGLDNAGRSVLFFQNQWSIGWVEQNNEGLKLLNTTNRL
ncbi:MAG: peptide chain release factor 3 [Clostridiales bacterium]|nr:peptide chain release factor 3 [Clostridiales bacterium]